jgi:hypothetical protein
MDAFARTAIATVTLSVLALASPARGATQAVRGELRTAAAPAVELDRGRATGLPGGAVIRRFEQRVAGIQVLGAEAIVNQAAGGATTLVGDSTRRNIDAPPAPRLSERRAVATATSVTGTGGLRAPIDSSLAIQPGGGGSLVWRVVVPSVRPLADFEVLIDAVSGSVLRIRDLLQDFKATRTARAQLYNPNPVVENGGFSGLRSDRQDGNTRLLTRLRVPVLLANIRNGQHCLRGRWAHARLGLSEREVCKRGLRWNGVKRRDDRFEALMAYYHVNRAQNYLHHLGFAKETSNGINDRSQTVVADSLSADNSFYSPSTAQIDYGSGAVDDAEDADVILHEYGHAMQDRQAPNFLASPGPEAGALAEGSGDYWAAAMSARSPGTSDVDDVCIFDWDGTAWGPVVTAFNRHCGRRADRSATVSERQVTCDQEIHCVGEVWSSALWKLRGELGNDGDGMSVMDRVYLAAQFMYGFNEKFGGPTGAAHDLQCADDNLYPAPGNCHGQHYTEISAEMTARGIV